MGMRAPRFDWLGVGLFGLKTAHRDSPVTPDSPDAKSSKRKKTPPMHAVTQRFVLDLRFGGEKK